MNRDIVELISTVNKIKNELGKQVVQYKAELDKHKNKFSAFEVKHNIILTQTEKQLKTATGQSVQQLFNQKNKNDIFFLYLREAYGYEELKITSQLNHIEKYMERLELFINYKAALFEGNKETIKDLKRQIIECLYSEVQNNLNYNIKLERSKKIVNDRLDSFLNKATIEVRDTYSNKLLNNDQKRMIENRKQIFEESKNYYNSLFINESMDISILNNKEFMNYNPDKVVELILEKQKSLEKATIKQTRQQAKR